MRIMFITGAIALGLSACSATESAKVSSEIATACADYQAAKATANSVAPLLSPTSQSAITVVEGYADLGCTTATDVSAVWMEQQAGNLKTLAAPAIVAKS